MPSTSITRMNFHPHLPLLNLTDVSRDRILESVTLATPPITPDKICIFEDNRTLSIYINEWSDHPFKICETVRDLRNNKRELGKLIGEEWELDDSKHDSPDFEQLYQPSRKLRKANTNEFVDAHNIFTRTPQTFLCFSHLPIKPKIRNK